MLTLFTIGHSNRPLDAFLEFVAAHEIRCIADVRAFRHRDAGRTSIEPARHARIPLRPAA